MFEFIEFSSFHFLRPWWLCLLLVAAWLLLGVFKRGVTRASDEIFAPHIRQALTVSAGRAPIIHPRSVAVVVVCIASITMAGPSWQRQESPFVQDQAELVIALDMSASMLQSDVQPSRSARAKLKILDLMSLRGGVPTGVVVFAGSAHQLLPLTNDAEITKQFLAAANHQVMPAQGKRAELAISIADRMLSTNNIPGSILLITDGFGQVAATELEDYFQSSQTQLIIFEIGLQTGQSGLGDEISSVSLASAAELSGGAYQVLRNDKSDVTRINRLIKHHRNIAGDDSRPWLDAGYYLLFPFAILLLLWFRSGWVLSCFVSLSVLAQFSMPLPAYAAKEAVVNSEQAVASTLQDRFLRLWFTPDQLGRWYFENGEYLRAAQVFENTQWRATAYYYAEEFTIAAELFKLDESALSRFNLANSYAQGQQYPRAIKEYAEVLTLLPKHQASLANKQRLEALVEEINQMSESQRAEAGKQTRELGDQPQRADGADENDLPNAVLEQLSAAQILADQQMLAMWMRQVQADPSRFLRAKFQLQYQSNSVDHGANE